MTTAPGPTALSDEAISDLFATHQFGVLATMKRSGLPHLATMLYRWDPVARIVRFSTTANRVKVTHLRNDPRVAVHVSGDDVWSYAVAEGDTELSEVTTAPGDAVGRELLAMLPDAARTDDDAAFLAQAVTERRMVIRLRVERLYGTLLDVTG